MTESERNKRKKQQEELEKLLKKIQQLIYQNYVNALAMPSIKRIISNKNDGFFFSNNHTAGKDIDKILRKMSKQMDYMLLNGIKREWKQGEETFWDRVLLGMSKKARDKKAYDQVRNTATQTSRANAAEAFYHEKRNGHSISDRVWNLAGNAKKEIEIIVQNGIKEGKSADEIQKSLKGYLNEPDKLFRRVRNKETGELEWSKAAQKYKPGRGVYRSAYKNAMRLARTELKAANCEAAWNAAQSNPIITGWQIVLSNNHTTLVNGVPVPFKDICDELTGYYPKSFKFRGWHPQCRCEMLPVLIKENERKELYKNIFDGKRDDWKPEQIKDVPKAFNDWIEQNKERAKGWQNMPRFVKDNRQFVKTDFDVNTYTDEEKKFTQARKTKEAMQRVLEELNGLYPDMPNTELAAIHHYTKAGGNYRQLNRQLSKGTLSDFNRASAQLIANGLQKLAVFSGTVYRGTIISRKEYERIYTQNEVVTHDIFTSASMDKNVAFRFANYKTNLRSTEVRIYFSIESKNSRNISDISEFNGIFAGEDQREVLFVNGTRFRQVEHIVDGQEIHIKMVEL